MIERPCRYCHKQFLTSDLRKKTCGCKKRKTPQYFENFMGNMRARFQNPKYQYFRLYHNEDLSLCMGGTVDYFYLRPCVEEVDFKFE